MERIKIDFGIDLGTTNSAIARMENGKVRIIKSDFGQKDTMPSCVYFKKNGIIMVGDTAYNRISDEHRDAFKDFSETGNTNHKFNTFYEFKRTMGTEASYKSDNAGHDFKSEELSAEVLKQLKSFVIDEDIQSVVITVPARFRNNQIDATQRAAELAGFKYCELLQEPIAASIAYSISAKDINGYWLVFDFGGGTFDAVLMRVEEGIMKVVDTDGDNHLGGKDIDYAIIDNIIIPYLSKNHKIDSILNDQYGKKELREALKGFAEEAKIGISPPSKTFVNISTDKPLGEDGEGKEIEIDIKMDLKDFEEAVSPIFQRAIDISKKLLSKNNLKDSDLERFLLVGGPTLSQTMRKMLKSQINTEIDTSIDPMTCVAVGAALFASSKDVPTLIQKRDKGKIQLTLKYPGTTVEMEENLGLKIDRLQTKAEIPANLYAEITRKDKGWSSGKVKIVGDAEIITLPLLAGNSNGFDIRIFNEEGNSYPCEPSSITIIQGFGEPPATLPFSLCIAAYIEGSTAPLIDLVNGLEKNQTLPAKGKSRYKTQKDIRPGNAQDRIKISIYEGDPNTRAIFNEPAGFVVITGEDLPEFLPAGSDVEITIEVDKSRRIFCKAFFPDVDETIDRNLTESSIQQDYNAMDLGKEIEEAEVKISNLEKESSDINLINSEMEEQKQELKEIAEILENGKSDPDTRNKVKERLREKLLKLDELEKRIEWPKVENDLKQAIQDLSVSHQRYGNNESAAFVPQIQQQSNDVINNRNVKAAKELIDAIGFFIFFRINFQQLGFLVSYIKYYDESFNECNWKNKTSGRKKVDEAKAIVANNPTVQRLQNKIREIWDEMPEGTPPPKIKIDDEILLKYR